MGLVRKFTICKSEVDPVFGYYKFITVVKATEIVRVYCCLDDLHDIITYFGKFNIRPKGEISSRLVDYNCQQHIRQETVDSVVQASDRKELLFKAFMIAVVLT